LWYDVSKLEMKFLPEKQVREILLENNYQNYFIGVGVDSKEKVVVLYRANMELIVVPFSWFTSSRSKVKADFENVRITDYGNTVALGEFEAATDAILFDFDPVYRCLMGIRSAG